MEPDGKWRVLSSGMQSNGTIAATNGNLLVCDMFGHRVVEVDPATGRVVRVVLDKVNGKPIDGPNDLVMDAKGGLYITDPQFTPEAQKSQPGKQVYYVAPDGTAKVVIGPGEYAMPNGVELSPDGKTLYVNNTWPQPGENFVWAYDVAADGSLSNKRQFAMLNLTPEVLGAAKPADRFDSGADGTAVDTDGRYYVATKSGVQIFLPDGTYAGTIWVPQYPVSITFGGAEQRRAVHGGRVVGVGDPDEGPRLPSSGGHELMRTDSCLPSSLVAVTSALAGACPPRSSSALAAAHRPHRPGRVPAVARRARRRRQHGLHVAAQSGRRDAGVQLPASRRDPARRRHRPPFPQRRRRDVRHPRRRSPVHDRRPHRHGQGPGGRHLPRRAFARHLQRRFDAGAVDEPERVDDRRRLRRLRSRRHPRGSRTRSRADVHDDAAGSRAAQGAGGARPRRRAGVRRRPSCRAARSGRRSSRRHGPTSITCWCLRAPRRPS